MGCSSKLPRRKGRRCVQSKDKFECIIQCRGNQHEEICVYWSCVTNFARMTIRLEWCLIYIDNMPTQRGYYYYSNIAKRFTVEWIEIIDETVLCHILQQIQLDNNDILTEQ